MHTLGSAPSLAPDLLLSFSCAEVSGLSTERVRELAIAVGQKNVTLQVDQVSCFSVVFGWGGRVGEWALGSTTTLLPTSIPTQDLAGDSSQSFSGNLN